MTLNEIDRIIRGIRDEFWEIRPRIIRSQSPDGWFHIQCWAEATDLELSPEKPIVQISKTVLERLTSGRRSFIRVQPELENFADFATGKTVIQSYVRFSFVDIPGECEYSKPDDVEIAFVGAAGEVVATHLAGSLVTLN